MHSSTITGAVPRRTGRRIRVRALLALTLVAGFALGAPAPARAGGYRAAICDPDLVAFHADAAFERNSRHYRPGTSCRAGGGGLIVRSDSGATRLGAWGGWVVTAPRGAAISALSLKAAGRSRGGHASRAPRRIGGAAEASSRRPRPD